MRLPKRSSTVTSSIKVKKVKLRAKGVGAILENGPGIGSARPWRRPSAWAKARSPQPAGAPQSGGLGGPRTPVSFAHRGAESPLVPVRSPRSRSTSAVGLYPRIGYERPELTFYHYPCNYVDYRVPRHDRKTGARPRVSFETLGPDRVSGLVRRKYPPDNPETYSFSKDA
jgi:hypothetical protein